MERTSKTYSGTPPKLLQDAGVKNGDKKTVLTVTYVVEKGKPLASPA